MPEDASACRAEPSFQAGNLRDSGCGVTLSLLVDAQPRACPTREAGGIPAGQLGRGWDLAPHLRGGILEQVTQLLHALNEGPMQSTMTGTC